MKFQLVLQDGFHRASQLYKQQQAIAQKPPQAPSPSLPTSTTTAATSNADNDALMEMLQDDEGDEILSQVSMETVLETQSQPAKCNKISRRALSVQTIRNQGMPQFHGCKIGQFNLHIHKK